MSRTRRAQPSSSGGGGGAMMYNPSQFNPFDDDESEEDDIQQDHSYNLNNGSLDPNEIIDEDDGTNDNNDNNNLYAYSEQQQQQSNVSGGGSRYPPYNNYSNSLEESTSQSFPKNESNSTMTADNHDYDAHQQQHQQQGQGQGQEQTNKQASFVSSNTNNNNADDTTNTSAGGGIDHSSAPIEASWQYLGDLPYRRIVIYDNVQWGQTTMTNDDSEHQNQRTAQDGNNIMNDPTYPNVPQAISSSTTNSLANVPAQTIKALQNSSLHPKDYKKYLASTLTTLIASCPNGGPIATLTKPTLGVGGTSGGSGGASSAASSCTSAFIRIMTNSGRILSTIPFPPTTTSSSTSSSSATSNNHPYTQQQQTQLRKYTPSDILTMGFTSHWTLLIVLRDSMCLSYTVGGTPILPPFYILNEPSTKQQHQQHGGGGGIGMGALELMQATIYDGGIAVLSANMTSALVEILQEDVDLDYRDRNGCHVASRIVKSTDWDIDEYDSGEVTSSSTSSSRMRKPSTSTTALETNTQYALITPLGTSAHAKVNFIEYTSIAVLPRIHTSTRHPEVFLGTSDNSVLIVDSSTGDITDVTCQGRMSSPIVRMSFAPNGRFLACFTKGLILTVISTNFETKVLDFDTSDGSNEMPDSLEWCGEDSVVLYWKNLGVLMVGPYGDWLRFPYEKNNNDNDDDDDDDEHLNLHICPDMDCCRIITDNTVEILQRVPPLTASMLRIGSIEPSAMLLDASDAFQNGSASSDEAARAITKTGMLLEAIGICTDAASKEFDVGMQKRLLRAASYGMHFGYKDGTIGGGAQNAVGIMGGNTRSASGGMEDGKSIHPSSTAIGFVNISRKMRVMNALRKANVGFVLTSAQYDAITPHGVIARLIAMKRPALATSLCTYLQLDEAVKAYARAARASAFVAYDVGRTDAESAESAMELLTTDVKSSLMNRGGYATVALAANKAGRLGVANLLLTLEMSIMDKVPALSEIGLHADAAAVATNARNADLIFRTLVELENSCLDSSTDSAKAQKAYLETVVKKFPPEAMSSLSCYFASMQDIKHVMNLQCRMQNYVNAGSIIAKRAIGSATERERLSLLQEASRFYTLGREKTSFQKTCTDDYLELINEQERLRHSYGRDIAPKTSSVTETIFNIICHASKNMRETHKLLIEGEKLAKKFKVPEKRMWHVKVRAFSTSSQWGNLRSLAESRTKPPIGFKHFAAAAIKGKQSSGEIMRYIDKVTDDEERYDLFCEAKLWKRAVDEARKMGDFRRMMHIRSLSNSAEILQLCDKYASTMA